MMLTRSCLLALFLPSWAACAGIPSRRDETVFSIIAPKAGDTFGLGTTSDRKGLNINWTVPEVIADRPVFMTLVQGDNIPSLSRVATINSSTLNNGSYAWRDFSYDSPLISAYGHGAPSGCNYSIEIKVWTDVVYSGYFTIINPSDGGLNTTSVCPEAGKQLGPANETFPSSGSSTSGSSGTSQTTTPGSTTQESSGLSTTTLAVAIVVPIVVLLLAFALIFWLARRRGWFVKKIAHDADQAAYNEQEKSAPTMHSDGYKSVATAEHVDMGELHSDSRPLDHAGHEVHEMNGDGERSRYSVRN